MSTQASPEKENDFDFASIEAAVRETERGRWFLAEYDRRGRIADTQALLGAIKKLEDLIAPGAGRAAAPSLSTSPAAIIAETRSEISAIRAQMMPDDRTQTANCDVFAALTIDAKILAVELAHLAEVLQAGEQNELSHLSDRLSILSRSHDALTRQIAAVSNLLLRLSRAAGNDQAQPASVARRLESLIHSAPLASEAALSEDNLIYFQRDEELFGEKKREAPLSLAGDPAEPLAGGIALSPAAGKNRIVIVHTSTSEARPIPLAEEAGEASQPAA
jgi:hypothetical protein